VRENEPLERFESDFAGIFVFFTQCFDERGDYARFAHRGKDIHG
jgi:hypothetical protein